MCRTNTFTTLSSYFSIHGKWKHTPALSHLDKCRPLEGEIWVLIKKCSYGSDQGGGLPVVVHLPKGKKMDHGVQYLCHMCVICYSETGEVTVLMISHLFFVFSSFTVDIWRYLVDRFGFTVVAVVGSAIVVIIVLLLLTCICCCCCCCCKKEDKHEQKSFQPTPMTNMGPRPTPPATAPYPSHTSNASNYSSYSSMSGRPQPNYPASYNSPQYITDMQAINRSTIRQMPIMEELAIHTRCNHPH